MSGCPPSIDLLEPVGKKYNMLKITECYRISKNKRVDIKYKKRNIVTRIYCECICDCGNIKPKSLLADVTRGFVKSCGCLNRKTASDRFKAYNATRPGLSKNPYYPTWIGIMNRCFRKKSISYKNYGGRGISVCIPWIKIENFLKWCEENPKPSPEYSLDRVDNDGWYGPHNCRWATRKEQSNNRRNTNYYQTIIKSLREELKETQRILNNYCPDWKEWERRSSVKINMDIDEDRFKGIEL